MANGPGMQWRAGWPLEATKTILPVMSRRAAITARHAATLDEVVRAINEVTRLHYHYYYCSAAVA